MDAPIYKPRSVYADRLAEYPQIARSGARLVEAKGRWQETFRSRLGSAFGGRVVLEIGCDDARFLSDIAADFPTVGFVGIDWKCRSIFNGARSVSGRGLQNIILLNGRAQDLPLIADRGEFDEVWVLHPEPCANPKEVDNRLIQEAFLLDVGAVLRGPGASFVFKTDHAGYFASVLSLFGLDEPPAYAVVRDAERTGKPRPAWPRLRRGDLTDGLPSAGRSEAVINRFCTPLFSVDFWNDLSALDYTASRLFAGRATPFESRFRTKKLAIGFLQATLRADTEAGTHTGSPATGPTRDPPIR